MVIKMLGLQGVKSLWSNKKCAGCGRFTNQRIYARSKVGKQLNRIKQAYICSPTCLQTVCLDEVFNLRISFDETTKKVLGIDQEKKDLTDSILEGIKLFEDAPSGKELLLRTSSIRDSVDKPHILEITYSYGDTSQLAMSDEGVKALIAALEKLIKKEEKHEELFNNTISNDAAIISNIS